MAREIRDYYSILGVSRDADTQAIRRAYRELLEEIDDEEAYGGAGPDLDEARREASEAYAVLTQSDARAAFDELRGHPDWWAMGDESDVDDEPDTPGIPPGSAAVESALRRVLRSGFGETGRRVLEFRLPFELAALGGRARARVPIRAACPSCGGIGTEMDHAVRCDVCGAADWRRSSCERCEGRGWLIGTACGRCTGDGWVPALGTVDLVIPPGVDDGTLLPVPGFREHDDAERAPRIRVKVSSHPYFKRVGKNIHCEVPVSKQLADRGSTIRVRTLRGKREALTIPPNTSDGTRLTLKGEGIESDGHRGDQIVQIKVRSRAGRKSGGTR